MASGIVSYDLLQSMLQKTADGGNYLNLINQTGATSIKGTLITISSTLDNAVRISTDARSVVCGVIYEDGIANGSTVKVVVSGKAQVLLKNTIAAVHGDWVGISNVAGRAYTKTDPPTGNAEHDLQVGLALESKAAGTDVLVNVLLRFR